MAIHQTTWSQEETDLLISIVKKTNKDIVRKFKIEAEKRGFPDRKYKSIMAKILRLGFYAKRWTDNEIQLLQESFNTYPQFMVTEEYNKLAVKNGYKARTEDSIWHIAYRLKIDKTLLENFPISDLARLLGVKIEYIRYWIDRGYLKTSRGGKNRIYISNKQLIDFAENHSNYLKGCKNLDYFFNSTLINKINKSTPPKTRDKVIVNIATGEKYKSIKECARKNFISYSGLRLKLRKNSDVFRFYDP
jgi:uncharacterized protein YihD (DUF1040 family)